MSLAAVQIKGFKECQVKYRVTKINLSTKLTTHTSYLIK